MANDYNDSAIVTMRFLEHVRKKAEMYAFQLNSVHGLIQQIKEVVDNSVDEALDPNKVYPIDITFFVTKDKSTYQVLVQDHGRGIPVGKLEACFCKEFTSGKYENKYGGASTGTFGIGSKASAALSDVFIAFTKRDDGFAYLRVERGVTKDTYTKNKRIDKDQGTIGTTVLFQPDPTMFNSIDQMFKTNVTNEVYTGFQYYLKQIETYSIFKRNVILTVRAVDRLLKPSELKVPPEELWKYLTTPENFKSDVIYQTDPSITPRVYVMNKFHLKEPVWELPNLQKDQTSEEDPLGYDIDIFIDERSAKGNNGIFGSVNATAIVHPESSHIAVLQEVIKEKLRDYILDDGAKAFLDTKYRVPFSGCVNVRWLGATFIGQDKSRFENRQFAVCYRNAIRKDLQKITQISESVWDKLYEIIKEHFEEEYAKFSKSIYHTGGSMKNIGYTLNRIGSYQGCISKDNRITELFITEGDSAAGRVKTVRDVNTQALLKLSGKPINAIRNDGKKLNANAIYQDIVKLIGVNPSDKNLDNMNFSRILLMTDADADGYHIVTLMIGLFYKINPLILSEGRVCVTNPPLYSLPYKNLAVYLRDEDALRDARINAYRVLLEIDIQIGNGRMIQLTEEAFRSFCMVVERIGDVLWHQADLLNIDALVLEQLIHCVDYLGEKNVNTEKIKEILSLENVIWEKNENALVLVDSGVEFRIPLVRLQEDIRAYILPEYEAFKWRDIKLFVTTKYTDMYAQEPCTFAMLYQVFQNINKIYKTRRFKGLGEMSDTAIKLTCVNPTTRCFTVIRGLGDVNTLYKMLDVDTDARKKLIDAGFTED